MLPEKVTETFVFRKLKDGWFVESRTVETEGPTIQVCPSADHNPNGG